MIIVILITILLLLTEHWFPWRLAMGKDLPRIPAYIGGVCALIIPLSVHWWMNGLTEVVLQAWIAIVSGGLALMLAYAVDWVLHRLAQARDLEKIEELHHARETHKGIGE